MILGTTEGVGKARGRPRALKIENILKLINFKSAIKRFGLGLKSVKE